MHLGAAAARRMQKLCVCLALLVFCLFVCLLAFSWKYQHACYLWLLHLLFKYSDINAIIANIRSVFEKKKNNKQARTPQGKSDFSGVRAVSAYFCTYNFFGGFLMCWSTSLMHHAVCFNVKWSSQESFCWGRCSCSRVEGRVGVLQPHRLALVEPLACSGNISASYLRRLLNPRPVWRVCFHGCILGRAGLLE